MEESEMTREWIVKKFLDLYEDATTDQIDGYLIRASVELMEMFTRKYTEDRSGKTGLYVREEYFPALLSAIQVYLGEKEKEECEESEKEEVQEEINQNTNLFFERAKLAFREVYKKEHQKTEAF